MTRHAHESAEEEVIKKVQTTRPKEILDVLGIEELRWLNNRVDNEKKEKEENQQEKIKEELDKITNLKSKLEKELEEKENLS